jgi:hypothetical protein
MLLPYPTFEVVKKECDAFNSENSFGEDALAKLWAEFPLNVDPAHVLLKTVVLNDRYSAGVRWVDVEPLAVHIAGINIDPLLKEASTRALDLITDCPNLQEYSSFASKFCSWHNPTAYPISDRYIKECLWAYKKQIPQSPKKQNPNGPFAKFKRDDLEYYEKLVAMVTAFRNHYELTSFNFKELDKFLWRLGKRIVKGENHTS